MTIKYCKIMKPVFAIKTIFAFAIGMSSFPVFATPNVTDVTAEQRCPKNGLVDITCKVSGIEWPAKTFWFTAAVVMPDTGNVRNVSHFGVEQNGMYSTNREVRTNGTYRLVWNASADLGQVIYDVVVRISLDLDAHRKVQLWEGGPYWADTNIGAEEPAGTHLAKDL